MKQWFLVSLIKNGIIGGSIIADQEAITYRTGKISVPQKYRNLVMKYKDISEVSQKWLFVLPTIIIKMKDGSEYTFAVFFNRKKLINILKSMNIN